MVLSTVMPNRRWLVLAALTLLGLTVALTTGASKASASLSCSGSYITINSGSGAENPSTAWGHNHLTGNHYVRYVYSDGRYEYWADNNGGWDGDTRDTYYGTIDCF